MKVTVSVIKADIGSVGGHIRPSARLFETVRSYVAEHANGLLIDSAVSSTGGVGSAACTATPSSNPAINGSTRIFNTLGWISRARARTET